MDLFPNRLKKMELVVIVRTFESTIGNHMTLTARLRLASRLYLSESLARKPSSSPKANRVMTSIVKYMLKRARSTMANALGLSVLILPRSCLISKVTKPSTLVLRMVSTCTMLWNEVLCYPQEADVGDNLMHGGGDPRARHSFSKNVHGLHSLRRSAAIRS